MHKKLPLIFRSLIVWSLVVVAIPASAQDYRAHNWYFGNTGAGIRFNRTDNTASLVNNSATTVPGGTAVATDPLNGNLLFYTDGQNIYDASHQVMFGGTGLNGNPNGNQPVAIAREPGQTDRYFVFVNTADGTTPGTVTYWTVDMTRPGNAAPLSPPLGEVVASNTAVPGLANVSEAMVTIMHDNNDDFFLVTHAQGTPDYHVTLFSANAAPATTTISGVGLIQVANNFAWHESSGLMAVSTQEASRDIEIVRLNVVNGALSFAQTIVNTAVPTNVSGEAIYDTEWSNTGRYLYISRHGEAGIPPVVWQADAFSSLVTLQDVLPQAVAQSYGLQMAPDSTIYHLYQETAGGPFLMGAITNPDTVAAAIQYSTAAFSGADFGAMQFPSFAAMDSVTLDVTFTSDGTCANTPVAFYPEVTPAADSLVWIFGDGTAGLGWSPVHTYEQAGAFPVTVIAFLGGDTARHTETVNIAAFDLELTLVQDTTACACELPINNGQPMANGALCPDDPSDDMTVTVQAQGGTPTYQWFGPGGILTGQTTQELRPDSAGYYYVIASIAGCAAYAGVNIKEYDSLNQQANIWHFGNTAGIDFNPLPDDPAVGIVGPLNAPEGSSVISDRNGQVILSTDGQSVYARGAGGVLVDITPAPNPPGLGGDPGATQSALIIPVPDDETLYYIFTTQAVDGPTGAHELRYSLFDIKRNNGAGEFVVYNQLLFARSTERITSNGNWLIAHEFGNNSFRAYSISAQGIGNPVISATGSDHLTTVLQHGQGYMEIGAQNRIAVALSTPGVSNVVEVFDFIDSTGVVTNFRTADLETTSGQVYGIELFGEKLFASLMDDPSVIFEFAFDSLGNPYLKQQVSYPGETIGAMQIGPDGTVYVARQGSASLWTFSPAADTATLTALDPLQDFALAGGTTSELGLPNFTQIISNPVQTPGFTFAGTCLGDSTTFNATGKDPAIDEFTWAILDENNVAVPLDNPDQQGSPQMVHTFTQPGTYTVSVSISNKCEMNYFSVSQEITVTPPPPDPSEGLTLCDDPLMLDANPDDLPDFTYAWSTGETTETIEVATVTPPATVVDVTITDAIGCTTDGSFLIADNRPQVEFGTDLTICQNAPIAPLDAQNPGANYAWFLQDVLNANTTQTQSVDTSTPGVFEYAVEVTDPVTACMIRDSIIYTINESPLWTATPQNPAACGSATGQIDLIIDSPDGTLFSWSVTGPVSESGTDQPSDVTFSTLPNLGAGTYAITVADQITGCATIATTSINDPAFTVTTVPDGTCHPDITINVTTGVTDAVAYRVIDDATGNDIIPTTNETDGDFFTLPVLNDGTYVVEVRQTSTNCVASSTPLPIQQATPVTVTFDNADICVDNTLTAVASGGGGPYTFDWTDSPVGSVNPDTGPTVTVDPGTWALTVVATDVSGTLCPGTATTNITVEPPITAGFTQSDACSDAVVLAASPAGNFTYRWYRNGVAIPGGGGQQIVAQTTDDQAEYRVELVSTQSGCVYASQPAIVNVAGEISVVLSTTTPCEGQDFTLTATPTPATITAFTWTYDGATLTETDAEIVDNREGAYEVFVTRSGCTVNDELTIVPGPVPQGLLLESYFICPGETLTLDAGPGAVSYQWYIDDVAESGATEQTFIADTPNRRYRVDLMNIQGCENSDATELIEKCDPIVTGPTAFRPSGINTEFFLYTIHVAEENFQVFIFNRWGEMVFQANTRDFRWNGGYANSLSQPLPPGTYTYIVKFMSEYDSDIREQRGGVVLLR